MTYRVPGQAAAERKTAATAEGPAVPDAAAVRLHAFRAPRAPPQHASAWPEAADRLGCFPAPMVTAACCACCHHLHGRCRERQGIVNFARKPAPTRLGAPLLSFATPAPHFCAVGRCRALCNGWRAWRPCRRRCGSRAWTCSRPVISHPRVARLKAKECGGESLAGANMHLRRCPPQCSASAPVPAERSAAHRSRARSDRGACGRS